MRYLTHHPLQCLKFIFKKKALKTHLQNEKNHKYFFIVGPLIDVGQLIDKLMC
jgi:hypothetical protein